MTSFRTVAVLSVLLLLVGVAACGDDDSNGTPDSAVGQDAGPDADTQMDAGPDAQVTQGCTGDPIVAPGEHGACCNSEDDCIAGFCFGGWCFQNCESDADCGALAAGPFPTGMPTTCQTNPFGFYNWCMPGSLSDCGGEGDPDCPQGETCAVGWNEDGQNRAPDGLAGICVTSYTVGVVGVGEVCTDPSQSVPEWYRCPMSTYHVGGCMDRRCTMVCDPEAATDPCPQGMRCDGPVAFDASNSPLSGAGYCVGLSCCSTTFTGDPINDIRMPGRDADCPAGYFCQHHGMPLGDSGERLEYTCVPSIPSLGQPGDVCEHAAKFDLGCDRFFLCIQDAAVYDPFGLGCQVDEDCTVDQVCVPPSVGSTNHCSPKPDPGVCSNACRTDADCPNLGGVPSYCNRQDWDLPNNQVGYLTFCLPWSSIDDDPEEQCDTNADCDLGIGDGCVIISGQSETTFCLQHITQDATGVDCATNGVADCQVDEACVEDDDAGTFACTGFQTFGDPCDPTDKHRCLGGSCQTIDGPGGAGDNGFCAGWCQSNADCGALQVCNWAVNALNDPTDSSDNVAGGHCLPMVVQSGAGCAVPGDCTNGDACDTTTGRCYTTAAAWGDACAEHSDCPIYGLCGLGLLATGACYRPGCDPANGNADCDNMGACSDGVPVGMCVEDCTTTADCDRSAEGFTCVNGACILDGIL